MRRLQKVGWIFAQSTKERDFIMSAEEVCQMAAIQALSPLIFGAELFESRFGP